MKKKLLALTALTLAASLCACSSKAVPTGTDFPTESEPLATSDSGLQSESESEPAPDLPENEPTEQQIEMQIFTEKYDVWTELFREAIDSGVPCSVAITDFDRDDNWELMISTCEGSGAYSKTALYEIVPGENRIERIKTAGIDDLTEWGDFSTQNDYECYMIDGKYSYLVEDYSSNGSSLKMTQYLEYVFGDDMRSFCIGDWSVSDFERNVETQGWSVHLYGPASHKYGDKESFVNAMNDYWRGYEKQPSLHIKWVTLPTKEECYGELLSSFRELDKNAEPKVTTYDYEIYGSDAKYEIMVD